MSELKPIRSIAEYIFKHSKADETEIIFIESESATTRFSNNVITQNVSKLDHSLQVKVLDNYRIGIAETNDLSEHSLDIVLNKAMKAMSVQKPDEEILSLPERQQYQPINRYDEEVVHLSPVLKAEWISKAANTAKDHELESSGIFENGYQKYYIANSKGLEAYHKGSSVQFNLSMEQDNTSGWYEQSSHSLNLINIPEIIDKALTTAIKCKSPDEIKPGKYTVILTPQAVGELIYFLAFYGLDTLSIIENANFFSGKLGQKVLSHMITIQDNVYHPLSSGIPFDFEGMPRKQVNLIEKGVFQEQVLDRKLAKQLLMESTGHSLSQPNPYGPLALNLVMKQGDTTIDDMIESTEYGLFVNRFHYTNILDPMNLNLTGMTRDGLFLIENGKITKPVKNFRFTQSLIEAFNHVEAVENKSTYIESFFGGGGFIVSGIKISQFNFSSATGF